MICGIPDCNKPFLARGFCAMHYKRFRRNGDPCAVVRTPKGKKLQWVNEVALSFREDKCLISPFRRNANGYVTLFVGGKRDNAHRYICRMTHGEHPPEKWHAAHWCGNRACLSPQHLRWATPTENQADKERHGTRAIGEKSGAAKLTAKIVLSIRQSDQPRKILSQKYGVSSGTIGDIQRRKSWVHL